MIKFEKIMTIVEQKNNIWITFLIYLGTLDTNLLFLNLNSKSLFVTFNIRKWVHIPKIRIITNKIYK